MAFFSRPWPLMAEGFYYKIQRFFYKIQQRRKERERKGKKWQGQPPQRPEPRPASPPGPEALRWVRLGRPNEALEEPGQSPARARLEPA